MDETINVELQAIEVLEIALGKYADGMQEKLEVITVAIYSLQESLEKRAGEGDAAELRSKLAQTMEEYERDHVAMQHFLSEQIPSARSWLRLKQDQVSNYLEVQTVASDELATPADTSSSEDQGSFFDRLGDTLFSFLFQSFLNTILLPFTLALGPFIISTGLGLSIGLPLFQIDLGFLDLIFGPEIGYRLWESDPQPDAGLAAGSYDWMESTTLMLV